LLDTCSARFRQGSSSPASTATSIWPPTAAGERARRTSCARLAVARPRSRSRAIFSRGYWLY